MHLSREIYKAYYRHAYRRDTLTAYVEQFLNDEKNFSLLKELNDKGIPPAVAFIQLTYRENHSLFSSYFKDRKDKQYFGELFGAAFYDAGYELCTNKNRRAVHLHNASVFTK